MNLYTVPNHIASAQTHVFDANAFTQIKNTSITALFIETIKENLSATFSYVCKNYVAIAYGVGIPLALVLFIQYIKRDNEANQAAAMDKLMTDAREASAVKHIASKPHSQAIYLMAREKNIISHEAPPTDMDLDLVDIWNLEKNMDGTLTMKPGTKRNSTIPYDLIRLYHTETFNSSTRTTEHRWQASIAETK